MIAWHDAVQILRQRIDSQHPLLRQMLQVTRTYEGAYAIPVPEDDAEPLMPILTSFTIANVIDMLGMRASSVLPYWTFPARAPEYDTSRERAARQKKAWSATCYESQFDLVQGRAHRHLAGYGTSSLRVVWDYGTGMPRIICEDPLSTFAEPKKAEDTRPPCNVGYVYEMNALEIRSLWPQARTEKGGPVAADQRGSNELWTLAEWMDDDQIMIGIVGPKFPTEQYRSYDTRQSDVPWLMLSWTPNYAGRCTAVVPKQISLRDIAMHVANAIGMSDFANKFMALGAAALEKGVYPDTYAIGADRGSPKIQGRVWKDGRDGEINILEDVTQVGQLRQTPDPQVWQVAQQLQDNIAMSLGLNPAQQGQATHQAMRTGRGIDTIVGAQTDPRIHDMHKIVEAYIPHLTQMAFAYYKGMAPKKKYEIFSGWPGDQGYTKFTPDSDLDADVKMVAEYAIAGADVQATTIELGQLRATEAISMKTYRLKHPHIGDDESEEHQVLIENMDKALMTSVLQGLAAPPGTPGGIDPIAGSKLRKKLEKRMPIFQAVLEVQQEMQEMQAMQPPPTPQGMGAPPELMPGTGGPEMPGLPPGMPQPVEGPPPVQGPNDSQANIRRLMLALKTNPGVSA